MALKAILDSIDGLADDLKSEYKPAKVGEKDVFVLDIEAMDTHPGVATMKNAMQKLKEEKKKANEDLHAANTKLKVVPEDFDPEEWLRLKTLDDDNGDDATKKAAREAHLQSQKKIFEDRIKALTEKHAQDLEAERANTAEARAQVQTLVVDGGLTKALIDAGVDKRLLTGAKSLLGSSVKTVVEDGKTRAFFETDMGEADVEDFVKQWVQSDVGKAYVPPAAGGGAGGGDARNRGAGDADNPFAARSWNKTKQSLLSKSDATKAERQAKQAGFKDLDTALKALRPPAQDKNAA